MRVGLITADPDHPVLAAVTALLTSVPGHRVEWLDPARPEAAAPGAGRLADVYLLKARTPAALALAARLEADGAPVINSAAATGRCQDRVRMAELCRRAGVPFAATRAVETLTALRAEGPPDTPLVVKSRHSRRHDLVVRVDGPEECEKLAVTWPDEPVVVQPFTENSGWDHKLWVVDGRLFTGLRRSELTPRDGGSTVPPAAGPAGGGRGPAQSTEPAQPTEPALLPPGWREVALRIGPVFGLEVYGVDVLDAGGGTPLVVDVNAFPGIRGQAGAPEALVDLALRVAAGGRRDPGAPPGSG